MKLISTTLIASAFSAAMAVSASADAEFKNSGKILPTTLPFSELVESGDTLYLSGQIGNIPGELKLVEGGIAAESRQVMENIQTSLQAHGYELTNLVKCTVILADIADWGPFNKEYAAFFEAGKFPARAAFGGTDLALGAKVEVDCIGHK